MQLYVKQLEAYVKLRELKRMDKMVHVAIAIGRRVYDVWLYNIYENINIYVNMYV